MKYKHILSSCASSQQALWTKLSSLDQHCKTKDTQKENVLLCGI